MIRHLAASAVALALITAPATAAPRLGFNLSGLEAGHGGALGWTHVAPTPAIISLAIANGATIFRIPFHMSRIYPMIGEAADPKELAAIKATADLLLATPGTTVILDDHSFGQQYGVPFGTAPWTPGVIAGQTIALLKALGYTNNARVWIDPQNEPHSAGSGWWPAVQTYVTALRAAGATNFLLVEGEGYSAADSWPTRNGRAAAAFVDPMHHVIFSPHEYFDPNGSGTTATCKGGSEMRIDPAIKDAEAHGYSILFGEMGFGADPSCDPVRAAVLAKLKESRAVIGVTFWTLSNFAVFPAYPFGLSATKTTPSPLMTKLLADWKK